MQILKNGLYWNYLNPGSRIPLIRYYMWRKVALQNSATVLPVLNFQLWHPKSQRKMFCSNLNPFHRIFFSSLLPWESSSIQNCTIVSNAITYNLVSLTLWIFLKSFDFFIFTFICTVTKLFAVSTKLPDLPSLTSHSGVTSRRNNIIRLWHSWKIEKKKCLPYKRS